MVAAKTHRASAAEQGFEAGVELMTPLSQGCMIGPSE
jgi:hypothetical protein